jgi:hypothetical protein
VQVVGHLRRSVRSAEQTGYLGTEFGHLLLLHSSGDFNGPRYRKPVARPAVDTASSSGLRRVIVCARWRHCVLEASDRGEIGIGRREQDDVEVVSVSDTTLAEETVDSSWVATSTRLSSVSRMSACRIDPFHFEPQDRLLDEAIGRN